MSNNIQTALTSQIQVNKKLNCHGVDKEQLNNVLCPKYNNVGNWETLIVSCESLIQIINRGDAIRSGIKVNGNGKDNVTTLQWLFLDFDNIPVKKTLENPLTGYAAFWYYSPSYKPGVNEKHRLAFQFEKPKTPEEYELIYQYLLIQYPEADASSKDSGRFFYGSNHPCTVIDTTNTVSENIAQAWLAQAKAHKSVTEKSRRVRNEKESGGITSESSTPESLTITTIVLEHIYKEWQEKLEGDIEKLYYWKGHRWWQEPRLEANPLTGVDRIVWHCGNPWKPPTDSTPSSFMITDFGDGFPPMWCDITGTFEKRHKEKNEVKRGSTIIEYHYQLHSDTALGLVKKNLYPKGLEGEGSDFRRVVDDLCKELGIDKFNWKDANKKLKSAKKESLKAFLNATFKNKVYKVATNARDTFYAVVDNPNSFGYRTWQMHVNPGSFYTDVLRQSIMEFYGEKVAEDPEIIGHILDLMSTWSYTIAKPPEENIDYLPYKNGAYDLKNKVLIPWEEVEEPLYNPCLLPHDYEFVEDDDSLIEKFKKFWGVWTHSEDYGKILLNWVVTNVQRRGYETAIMVGLFGASGKGKTAYNNMINNLMGDYAIKPETETFFSGYAHANEILEGKYFVFFEELTGKSQVTGKANVAPLKKLAGSPKDKSVTINKKGISQYSIKSRAAYGFDCELMIQLPDEKGYTRRIIFIEMLKSMTPINQYPEFLEFEQNLAKISSWCAQQDVEVAKNIIKEAALSDDVKNALSNVKRENDTFAQFILEKLEIVDNPETSIKADDLWSYHSRICQAQGYGTPFASKIKFNKIFLEKLSDDALNFGWKGEKKKAKSGEFRDALVYTCLKYRSETEDNDFEG